jgi:hypothetical protein
MPPLFPALSRLASARCAYARHKRGPPICTAHTHTHTAALLAAHRRLPRLGRLACFFTFFCTARCMRREARVGPCRVSRRRVERAQCENDAVASPCTLGCLVARCDNLAINGCRASASASCACACVAPCSQRGRRWSALQLAVRIQRWYCF